MKNLLLILLFAPALASAQDLKITGTITYFFNKYQGNKPDLGAKVYIIDSSINIGSDISVIDSFIHGREARELYLSHKQFENSKALTPDQRAMPVFITELIKKYGVETADGFDKLDHRCFSNFLPIEYKEEVIKGSINANGDFSIPVPKIGTYYVLVQSANRQGHSISEVSGKFYLKKVSVMPGKYVNITNNFDVY